MSSAGVGERSINTLSALILVIVVDEQIVER